MQNILIGLIGICAGVITASGLCAVFVTIGVVTRIALKTKTADKMRLYENCILVSAVLSTYIYIYDLSVKAGAVLSFLMLGFIGIFFGIFVGCLAVALAEALDASTILFRRIKLTKNTKYILLAIAIGKFVGNIIFFIY